MTTPLDKWVSPLDRWVDSGHPGFHAPLDVAMIVLEYLDTPESIVNYALSHRDLLDYWIQFTGATKQSKINADPESDPRAFDPNPAPASPPNPAFGDPTAFRQFARRIIRRIYSPLSQRCILTAITQPNPSRQIYDVDYRRANPIVGNPNPFPELIERKADRFRFFWESFDEPNHADLLFTFKAFNHISPLDTACRRFALDFAKKALSAQPSLAHHSPPLFAHPSLRLPVPDFEEAVKVRDQSPLLDFNQLHETERERLLCSFYMYEALCATSLKVSGDWEIRHSMDSDQAARQQQAEDAVLAAAQQNAISTGQPAPASVPPGMVPPVAPTTLDDWNAHRCMQSPLWSQSACQVERVRSIYMYVRLQWHLMFHALFVEWHEELTRCAAAYNNPAVDNATFFGTQDHTPKGPDASTVPWVFLERAALVEWIEVLCSKGLVFLHEALCMSADQRRQMLVSTFYPTRWTQGPMSTEDYLVKGLFSTMSNHKTTLMNNNQDTSFSDELGRAHEQNFSWVMLNTSWNNNFVVDVRDVHFADDRYNPLRRRGYVFWNRARIQYMSLAQWDLAAKLMDSDPPADFADGRNWLDSPFRKNQAGIEFAARPVAYPDMVWQQAARPFETPRFPPALVRFPILGQTVRIWEYLDVHGRPVIPTLS
ncbi:hypothetical protein F4775DRAFT_601149 [Biscogniauxia sp. FL1348]|nr:hypothetical protein F4775DRAFT_601149 [Biscogniauxia sp. FL1348]